MTPVEAYLISQIIYAVIVCVFVVPAMIGAGIDVYRIHKTKVKVKK